jgi:hypothetical protein
MNHPWGFNPPEDTKQNTWSIGCRSTYGNVLSRALLICREAWPYYLSFLHPQGALPGGLRQSLSWMKYSRERFVQNKVASSDFVSSRKNGSAIHPFSLVILPGDYCGEATPVPIPNTEVKLSYADGTASRRGGRVGRRQAFFISLIV